MIIDIHYDRASDTSGSGVLYLYIDDGVSALLGGWSVELVENTRLAGFTLLTFKSAQSLVSLWLRYFANSGWGHVKINGETKLLDCTYH